MKQEHKGIWLILLYECLIGISPVATKSISPSLPGQLLVSLRFAIASVALMTIIGLTAKSKQPHNKLSLKQAGVLVLLGLLGSGVASILNVTGIRAMGAVVATLIANLEIPIGIGLGAWILGEKLTKSYFAYVGLILVGFGLLTGIDKALATGVNWWSLGAASSLGAAVVWGICTVLGKLVLEVKVSPLLIALVRVVVGSGFSLGLFMTSSDSLVEPIKSLRPADWVYLIYLGAVVSGLGMWIYYVALQRLTVKKMVPFFTLQIVVTTTLGVVVGETLSLTQWAGMIMITSGLLSLVKLEGNV